MSESGVGKHSPVPNSKVRDGDKMGTMVYQPEVLGTTGLILGKIGIAGIHGQIVCSFGNTAAWYTHNVYGYRSITRTISH